MVSAPVIKKQPPLSASQKRFGLAIVAGAILRFLPTIQSGQVIHDGGLFYRFALDILAAHWHLPIYTTYNQSQIPFAYPPLAFYLLAGLRHFLHLPLMALLRWLPPLLGSISILAFSQFGKRLLKDEDAASWATLVYAFMPQAIAPQIMGGGLTRALGATFAFLFLASWMDALEKPSARTILGSGLLAGLLVLTHPEWTLHAVIAGILLWCFRPERWQRLLTSLSVAGLAGLFSLPWWGSLLYRHGWAIFNGIRLAKATYDGRNTFLRLRFTGEIIPVLLPLALLGIVLAMRRHKWSVASLTPTAMIAEPRSFVRASPLHMAPPIGLALDWLWQRNRYLRLLAFGMIVLSFGNGFIVGERLALYHTLSQNDLQAIAWSAQNLPAGANVLVLTSQDQEMAPVIEWLPALTDLHSLLTAQGSEWQTNQALHYANRLAWGRSLTSCLDADLQCLEEWMQAHNLQVDLIYITTALSDFKSAEQYPLYQDIAANPKWELVYTNPRVRIYQQHP